jgi:hypothetical protein
MIGMTPCRGKWARCKASTYPGQHRRERENTHPSIHLSIYPSMFPAGMEPTISAFDRHRIILNCNLCIEWRKLHNEELTDLYSLPNIVRVVKSRRMRWAGHVARMGEERGVHRALVGKFEGKRPLGRPRRRWEDNIKMDVQEVGGGRGDWM